MRPLVKGLCDVRFRNLIHASFFHGQVLREGEMVHPGHRCAARDRSGGTTGLCGLSQKSQEPTGKVSNVSLNPGQFHITEASFSVGHVRS